MHDRLTRRRFLAGAGCAVSAGALLAQPPKPAGSARPNILWITSEDNGPHLGAYGDTFATTPNLDRLAAKGRIYRHVWSNAPVCAPARTAIITGMYPQSAGAEHMRSTVDLPEGARMFPQYLREAGYYCTNNSKEDYNLEKPGKVWDESSNSAHWRNRAPSQPFFAVFNFTVTHESQIRRRPHTPVHDPEKVPVPPYHPDTPEVRLDWAQYYDKMNEMDAQAGEVLRQLKEDGLADDTIVFYYGDHGPGMPRNKRWPFNCGLSVPLIVHMPEKFRHLADPGYQPGSESDRLVGFVDLAPTVLSLAGITPPETMHGSAFLGNFRRPDPDYIHGFRGRMDERYDMVRSVRDRRYVYVRNYMPHKIYGQYLDYMFQTPTTRVWKQLYDEGRLTPPQTFFWEEKPIEELYDLEKDPHEVRNLAHSPDHGPVLGRLRREQQRFALEIRDLGFLPEDEIHSRSAQSTPLELSRDKDRYPLERILPAAERAARRETEDVSAMIRLLSDSDSAVRYWAAMGLVIRGGQAVRSAREALRKSLSDPAPSVRIHAAQALAEHGEKEDLPAALNVLIELAHLEKQGLYVAVQALNAIDSLGAKAKSIRPALEALPRRSTAVHQRMSDLVDRLLERILALVPNRD
jgi:arylsulfatase A-like enzyme